MWNLRVGGGEGSSWTGWVRTTEEIWLDLKECPINEVRDRSLTDTRIRLGESILDPPFKEVDFYPY